MVMNVIRNKCLEITLIYMLFFTCKFSIQLGYSGDHT